MIAQLVACTYIRTFASTSASLLDGNWAQISSSISLFKPLALRELLLCQFLLFDQGRVSAGARSAGVLSAPLSSLFKVGHVTLGI